MRKIIRCLIAAFSFLCVSYLIGMETREAQQFLFAIGCIGLFSLIIDNIWITLFIWWTVFLYIFFKQLDIGYNYVLNVLFGSILYYVTKVSFKKEHIVFFFNTILWLCLLNIAYMSVQALGLDWIFSQRVTDYRGLIGFTLEHKDMAAFMGFKACMGMLMVMSMPILLSRNNLTSRIAGVGLLIPIYLSQSSICVLVGFIMLVFMIYHKLKTKNRLIFVIALSILLLLGSLFYAFKIDDTPTSITLRITMWREILKDTVIHPVTGWGLDSFRHITQKKAHLYAMNPTKFKNIVHLDYIDNPHNLYISIFYEWGIIGLFILMGYLRFLGIRFYKSIKTANTLALSGIIISFLILSMVQFPIFLARVCVIIIPIFALFEIQTGDNV